MSKIIVNLPLLNLLLPDSYSKKIVFSKRECIRKVDSKELRLQQQKFSLFVLEIIRQGKDFTNIGNDIVNFASYFIKVLTLFKRGRIGYGRPVYIDPKIQTMDDYKKYFKLTVIDILSSRSMGIWNPNYRLLEDEIERLITFYNKMSTLPFDKRNKLNFSINISLERLARTSKSIEVYEKLLDCMMSLEAIFLRGEGELSYRLSHRIANIFGESDDERKNIFNFIKKCYNDRSKVLHGERFDVEGFDYILTVEDLEEITRKCIRQAIALSQLKYTGKNTKEQFLKDLDSCTFDTKLRAELQSYEKKYFKVDFPRANFHFMEDKNNI